MTDSLTTLMQTDRMLGAAFGDIAGSIYEFNNIKYKLKPMQLYRDYCYFTDDTVMTAAVALGITKALTQVGADWCGDPEKEQVISRCIETDMVVFGKRYPHAGYGGRFSDWIEDENRRPYGSWGNGSAMRASFAGWAANSMEEAERLAVISADVTHNCDDGEAGAKVVAGCIYLLRSGADKTAVRKYTEKYYPLGFTLDDIRDAYRFDVSCHGTVPYAIKAFLEADSFEETAVNALSIGGDSDTLAAIACSVAEVYYPLSSQSRGFVLSKLDDTLIHTLAQGVSFLI